MPDEFGARQTDRSLYTNGQVDFEKVKSSAKFIAGIKRVELGLLKGYNIVFMCSENLPYECHRNILIGRSLNLLGYDIINIVNEKQILPQEKVDKILLDMYFPNRSQLSLFDQPANDENLIEEAYMLKSKEIAYREESREFSFDEDIHHRIYQKVSGDVF